MPYLYCKIEEYDWSMGKSINTILLMMLLEISCREQFMKFYMYLSLDITNYCFIWQMFLHKVSSCAFVIYAH